MDAQCASENLVEKLYGTPLADGHRHALRHCKDGGWALEDNLKALRHLFILEFFALLQPPVERSERGGCVVEHQTSQSLCECRMNSPQLRDRGELGNLHEVL